MKKSFENSLRAIEAHLLWPAPLLYTRLTQAILAHTYTHLQINAHQDRLLISIFSPFPSLSNSACIFNRLTRTYCISTKNFETLLRLRLCQLITTSTTLPLQSNSGTSLDKFAVINMPSSYFCRFFEISKTVAIVWKRRSWRRNTAWGLD